MDSFRRGANEREWIPIAACNSSIHSCVIASRHRHKTWKIVLEQISHTSLEYLRIERPGERIEDLLMEGILRDPHPFLRSTHPKSPLTSRVLRATPYLH